MVHYIGIASIPGMQTDYVLMLIAVHIFACCGLSSSSTPLSDSRAYCTQPVMHQLGQFAKGLAQKQQSAWADRCAQRLSAAQIKLQWCKLAS